MVRCDIGRTCWILSWDRYLNSIRRVFVRIETYTCVSLLSTLLFYLLSLSLVLSTSLTFFSTFYFFFLVLRNFIFSPWLYLFHLSLFSTQLSPLFSSILSSLPTKILWLLPSLLRMPLMPQKRIVNHVINTFKLCFSIHPTFSTAL